MLEKPIMAEVGQDEGLLGFCVVANVARETAHGEGGLEIRRGVKHFSAGAKLWVLPIQWGDGGGNVIVAGRHRSRPGPYIRMVVPRRHLENFRVQGIYSPALLRALAQPWKDSGSPALWSTREEAEQTAARWNRRELEARTQDHRILGQVSDPPPLDLQRHGQIYHLAHFNTRRAIYSALPPPIEPSP